MRSFYLFTLLTSSALLIIAGLSSGLGRPVPGADSVEYKTAKEQLSNHSTNDKDKEERAFFIESIVGVLQNILKSVQTKIYGILTHSLDPDTIKYREWKKKANPMISAYVQKYPGRCAREIIVRNMKLVNTLYANPHFMSVITNHELHMKNYPFAKQFLSLQDKYNKVNAALLIFLNSYFLEDKSWQHLKLAQYDYWILNLQNPEDVLVGAVEHSGRIGLVAKDMALDYEKYILRLLEDL
uniref:RxLR effector candidate protein n=1 Tax=Hyaloperonospora arabidopsidis (strain Emoy2) TaxID=559515 RepID=M4B3D8_HYAAE|nr:RxLR effector candidate protein [Hyaloperonospora arabidopsidis Emoy2]